LLATFLSSLFWKVAKPRKSSLLAIPLCFMKVSLHQIHRGCKKFHSLKTSQHLELTDLSGRYDNSVDLLCSLSATPLGLKRRFAGITSDGAGGTELNHLVLDFPWQRCQQVKYCRMDHMICLPSTSMHQITTHFLSTKTYTNVLCPGCSCLSHSLERSF
jgi:hypothetical protein